MPSVHGLQGPQLSLSTQFLAAKRASATATAKGDTARVGHQPQAAARPETFALPAKAGSGSAAINVAAGPNIGTPSPTTTPAPGVLGDIDGDGQMNSADAHALLSYLFQGGAAPVDMSRADVNGDGSVNLSDVTQLFDLAHAAATPPPAGDMDGDGQITAQDGKLLLNALFGDETSRDSIANADFNGDGSVNISDAIGMLNLTLNPMLAGKSEERA